MIYPSTLLLLPFSFLSCVIYTTFLVLLCIAFFFPRGNQQYRALGSVSIGSIYLSYALRHDVSLRMYTYLVRPSGLLG